MDHVAVRRIDFDLTLVATGLCNSNQPCPLSIPQKTAGRMTRGTKVRAKEKGLDEVKPLPKAQMWPSSSEWVWGTMIKLLEQIILKGHFL